MQAALAAFFASEAQRIADDVVAALAKDDEDAMAQAKRALDELDMAPWQDLTETLWPMYIRASTSGAQTALLQVATEPTPEITQLANQNAIAYAKQRGAELVGMRITEDGEIIENPNPAWRIQDSTRDMIRHDVVAAMEEGMSNDRLADVIRNSTAFSEDRAATIATTETAWADQGGQMQGWKASGLVQKKRWLYAQEGIGGDNKACPVCHQNAGKTIRLDQAFPSGALHAPQHPRCRCAVVAIIEDEDFQA